MGNLGMEYARPQRPETVTTRACTSSGWSSKKIAITIEYTRAHNTMLGFTVSDAKSAIV